MRYHAILKDLQTFGSGRRVGLSGFAAEEPWCPPTLRLGVDPLLYDRTRSIVGRVVSVGALKALRPASQETADSLVRQLIARLEAELILTELLKHCSRLEPAGQSRPRLNNMPRAWESFPIQTTLV